MLILGGLFLLVAPRIKRLMEGVNQDSGSSVGTEHRLGPHG